MFGSSIGFTHEGYDGVAPIDLLHRLLYGFNFSGTEVKMFWNFAHVSSVSYSFAVTPSTCEGRLTPGEFFARELLTFTLQMLMTKWIEEGEMWHYFQMRENDAFNALLTAAYDVTIELNDNSSNYANGQRIGGQR